MSPLPVPPSCRNYNTDSCPVKGQLEELEKKFRAIVQEEIRNHQPTQINHDYDPVAFRKAALTMDPKAMYEYFEKHGVPDL